MTLFQNLSLHHERYDRHNVKKVKRAVSGENQQSRSTEEWVAIVKGCAIPIPGILFEEDDNAIYDIKREYESGRMLAGEMKQLCIERLANGSKKFRKREM